MPLFNYRARDEVGKKVEGFMSAQDKNELAHTLKNQGLILVFANEKIEKVSKWQGLPFLKKVSLTEKMMFIKHLSVMIKAGLPIPRALEILAIQTGSAYFREVINSIKEKVKTGQSLADGMKDFPKVFPPLFSSAIRIGEIGGNLEEVLELLGLQLQKDHDIRSKIKGALIYPSVIIVAMVAIGILLMMFVVPNLMKIFSEMDIELPISTRIVIGISKFLSSHTIISLLIMISSPIVFSFLARSPGGKQLIDFILLKIPMVGSIIKKVNTARFSRTLSSLLKSGVAIVTSLDIIADSLDNTYFKRALKKCSEMVQKGIALNKATEEFPSLFPPMVIQMIRIGEETGSSEQILAQLADFYEKEVDDITKNLSSIIEPILILVIGGGVGFFAISVIQPMYMVMDYIE